MPGTSNGINPDNKLLDGHGLGTVLSLLKGQMNYESDSMFTFVTTTFVSRSAVTPILVSGTTIANIEGKTIYAPSVDTSSFVPVTTTNGNVKTQFITQSSTTGMTLRISDGNPNTHQALLKMESTNESYPKTKAQLLADDILIQGTTLTLQGVKTPTNNTDAANKKYVDDQISSVTTGLTNYVPKEVTGGTITFEPGNFAVDFIDSNEQISRIASTTNTIEIMAGDGATESAAAIMMGIQNGSSHLDLNAQHLIISSNDTRISGVVIPTSNLDAANKLYVDDQITAAVTPYVEKSSVISTGPTNGTAIANVAGITIYAPVAQGGVTVESDPVFTSWATGSGIAAYTITATDVANWNGVTTLVSNVQSDWNATTGLSTILNKPSIKAGSGSNSIQEGFSTQAQGTASHAEGSESTAKGMYSHAEGDETEAGGKAAHSEGSGTYANGNYSHAEGQETVANSLAQHVVGTYNIVDTAGTTTTKGTYVEIVGNGTASTPSNARTLDWNGNETLAGKLTIGITPTAEMDAANKGYVDSQINSVTTGLTNYVPKEVIDSTIATTITVDSDGFKVEASTNNQENISSVSVNPVNGKIELTAGEYLNEHYAGIQLGGENGKSYMYMQADDVAISGLTTPTYPLDAANKKYVDDQISGVTSALTTYVAKTDVTPAAGITGTVIATIGGKTIYAPVSEEGIQSETDPVFTASAAAGITTGDISNWNAKSSITPVNADWNATTGLSSILNKPSLGTAATLAISDIALASHTHDYVTVNMISGFANISDVPFIDPILNSGTAVATVTVGSSTFNLYAPEGFSGDYADLSNTPSIPSISATAAITTGVTIGTVTIDNSTTTFYAPTYSIAYDSTNTALVFNGF